MFNYVSGNLIFAEDTHPEVVFSRHSRLAFTEITSYKADPSLKWLAITGLTPEVGLNSHIQGAHCQGKVLEICFRRKSGNSVKWSGKLENLQKSGKSQGIMKSLFVQPIKTGRH